MARAKRSSDELYNARRRVRRLADRYERKGDTAMAAGLRDLAKVGRGATIETLNSAYQAGKVQLAGMSYRAATKGTAPTAQPQTQVQQQQRERTPRPKQPTSRPTQPQRQSRTPRPKRPSDEVYNARRRLKRAAERLLKKSQAEPDVTAGKVLKGYAQYLLQQALPTGKLSKEERTGALERLGRLRKKVGKDIEGGFRVQRRNAIIMQQLNAAGTEGADSAISERQKDVFWASTKGLWPIGSNVPRNDRYDKILEHFYSDDTTDAKEFRAWLEEKKGTTAQDSFGDLQLVYEYVTEEMNDPALYDAPELPYDTAMQYVITAM